MGRGGCEQRGMLSRTCLAWQQVLLPRTSNTRSAIEQHLEEEPTNGLCSCVFSLALRSSGN